MITSIFNKPDLLKTFLPLTESGKTFLEFLLVNPKTATVEGRGFFNDVDFLIDSCKPLIGRYNFCLSHFGFPQAEIPTRAAYNQFDRTLMDATYQDQARVHSLSLAMLFKPELIREMSGQTSNVDHFQNIVNQINVIFSRLGLKTYSIDYFLTGVTLRFCPTETLRQRPLNKAALSLVTKSLLESVEKKMLSSELKRFVLASSVLTKMWDPAPGLPGMFTGEESGTMIVASAGALEPAEESVFASLLEDIFEPKKKPEKESYTAPNILGLSQSWQETQEAQYETTPEQSSHRNEKSFSASKEEYVDPKTKELTKELVAYFHSQSQGKWRWPMYSANFNRLHKGVGSGEMLLLNADPFASELGFQFLMQSAEAFIKEGSGQLLVFSKKRSLGDLALGALSRHYKTNPLTSKLPGVPDAAGLVKAFGALFPNLPLVQACNRNDGLDQLQRYLEHDYLLQQKKKGGALIPLVILIDNLAEFSIADEDENFRRLSQIKAHLREFNGSLWTTQFRPASSTMGQSNLSLADYVLNLDYNGILDSIANGKGSMPFKPSEWEAGFQADFSPDQLIQEISLLKIRFQTHGSHRGFVGHYAFHRPSSLFHEVAAIQATNQTPQKPAITQSLKPVTSTHGVSQSDTSASGSSQAGTSATPFRNPT